MAQSRGRTDLYGRPLPALSDAERQSLLEHPKNVAMRAFVRAVLEQHYGELCRRNTFAQLTVDVTVRDGFLQHDLEVTTRRRFHAPDPEER